MIHFILMSLLISRWLYSIDKCDMATILNILMVISIVVFLILKFISIELVLFIVFFLIVISILVERIMFLRIFHTNVVWRLIILLAVGVITGYLLTFFSNIVYFIWFEILSTSSFILGFKKNFNKSQQLLEIFTQDKTKAMEVNKKSKKLWILSGVIYIVMTGIIYFSFR